jgi:hypothetical protein
MTLTPSIGGEALSRRGILTAALAAGLRIRSPARAITAS